MEEVAKPRRVRHRKPTELENAGRALRRAAQILNDKGWIRGIAGSATVGYCALGAIRAAMYPGNGIYSSLWSPPVFHFANWLGKEIPLFSDIPSWNDRMVHDATEVITYMRKFADEVDPQCP